MIEEQNLMFKNYAGNLTPRLYRFRYSCSGKSITISNRWVKNLAAAGDEIAAELWYLIVIRLCYSNLNHRCGRCALADHASHGEGASTGAAKEIGAAISLLVVSLCARSKSKYQR